MSLRLIIEDDEGTTTVVPLGADAITIGRQQGNTIQLTEKNVSRRHARLYPDREAWIVEDLGSYNGVKVNAHRVEGRVVLQEGDVIQIGDYHLALTENVDKRTLNYDRPPAAANDGEPLLVSSSTDLPRLSPEELAALSPGQHTPQPMLLDSGSVPAMSSPHYAREHKSGSGVLIAGIVVVVAALGLGGAWLATSGNAPPETTKVADASKPAGPAAEVPPTPTPEPEAEPVAVVEDDAADEVVADGEPAAESGVEHEEPAVEDLQIDPTPAKPEPRTKQSAPRVAKSKPASTSQSPSSQPRSQPTTAEAPSKPPPPPPVDVDQLLNDARQASMVGPFDKAYELARKAYKEKPSQEALVVMATAACKMGSASKAKFAIGKLTGKRKDDVKKLCESMGVTI